MVFDFLNSIETQPILLLSLDHSVDEVNALLTPTIRDLIFFYLNLPCYHCFPDLLT